MSCVTAKSIFVETNGFITHAQLAGPPGAPAVLLIHSLGASLEIWEAQAQLLSRGFHVIRYDLRGHGLSELAPAASGGPLTVEDYAGDAIALVDSLGIHDVHVAGISIGGLIAQAIAAAIPRRVRSLCLCGTALSFPPPSAWMERVAAVRRDGLAPLVDGTMDRWISKAYQATPAGRGLRALFLRTSAQAYAAAAESLATADLSTRTPHLAEAAGAPIPALVIVGDNDPSSPPARAAELAAALPGSKLVVIPGAYHVPLGEHAAAVNEALLEHLTLRGPAGEDAGARVRAEVLGADYVNEAALEPGEFGQELQAYLKKSAWAEVWARPHFDRRTRSIVTLALLAGLGREHELMAHIRAMKRTGATPEDLTEVLLHVAVYAGAPAANAAMRAARRVMEEIQ
jgi:3-oxoadipate enol-lactonase / 4-carboxymuconolactone decarboxylase